MPQIMFIRAPRRNGGNDSFTKLLLHCDGADGSTTFTDSSAGAHTVTAAGNAQIDTAQKKFGTGSLLCDGTGDFATSNDHADYELGSADFTIDKWVRWNSVGANQTLISKWFSTGNQRSWLIYYDGTNIRFQWSTDGSDSTSVARSWSPSNGTWYHLAVVRTGSIIRIFIDGTQIGTDGAISATIFNGTGALNIGGFNGDGTFPFNGWLDEIRLSPGIARWTSNFTPPTAAYF